MRDKERIVSFLQKLIPDDFICGHIAVTFNDDGSLVITVSNQEDNQECITTSTTGKTVNTYTHAYTIGKTVYRHNCSDCGYRWWSENEFETKCRKCGNDHCYTG